MAVSGDPTREDDQKGGHARVTSRRQQARGFRRDLPRRRHNMWRSDDVARPLRPRAVACVAGATGSRSRSSGHGEPAAGSAQDRSLPRRLTGGGGGPGGGGGGPVVGGGPVGGGVED